MDPIIRRLIDAEKAKDPGISEAEAETRSILTSMHTDAELLLEYERTRAEKYERLINGEWYRVKLPESLKDFNARLAEMEAVPEAERNLREIDSVKDAIKHGNNCYKYYEKERTWWVSYKSRIAAFSPSILRLMAQRTVRMQWEAKINKGRTVKP